MDDLNNGFLLEKEFLIAGEIFDSVLEEAKELLNAGHKNPAAVLGKVVLEDALKILSHQEQLDDTQKATKLNDDLKKAGRYSPRFNGDIFKQISILGILQLMENLRNIPKNLSEIKLRV